jgi:hypothetical protein
MLFKITTQIRLDNREGAAAEMIFNHGRHDHETLTSMAYGAPVGGPGSTS